VIPNEIERDVSDTPKVSVVIPSIDDSPYLYRLTEDLFEGTRCNIEIIVSHSGTSYPYGLREDVVMVHQPSPLLASAARNRGALHAKGQYLFFIDDDNEVSTGVVDVLASLLDRSPNLVEVGPAMYYASERDRAFCFGVSHRRRFNRTHIIVQMPTDGSREIVSEALPNAFMVRRREFEAIGGFDEISFPMDFEESDLAFRLRRLRGGYLACALDAVIWHHAPVSVKQQFAAKSLARSYYSARNRPILIARHLGLKCWFEYVLVGQFPVALARLWGVMFGSNRTTSSRASLCAGYIAGMTVGVPLSIREMFECRKLKLHLSGWVGKRSTD